MESPILHGGRIQFKAWVARDRFPRVICLCLAMQSSSAYTAPGCALGSVPSACGFMDGILDLVLAGQGLGL